MEALESDLISRLWERISRIAEINGKAGIPQENFVLEESSEFIKEFMTFQRDESIRDGITAEAIDLLTALLVYFERYHVNMWNVCEQIIIKLDKAIYKYEEHGEV